MSRIFFDTNPYVYLFERHPVHMAEVQVLRQKMLSRGDELLTSWLTVGEVQVRHPKAQGRLDTARYRQAIVQTARVLSFDEHASDFYREIRETTSIKGPDALQLACASSAGVELFVTNDKQLHGVRVKGIHFIVSIATAVQLL